MAPILTIFGPNRSRPRALFFEIFERTSEQTNEPNKRTKQKVSEKIQKLFQKKKIENPPARAPKM